MSQAFATKLIDVTEQHAEEIARQWFRDVTRNQRTPSYHGAREDILIAQAVAFYRKFRRLFFSSEPFVEARKFFSKYAEDSYSEGIPLHEALYALILMRRHIWLYAQFQTIFMTAIEHQQASESLNRTILLFDYAVYVIAEEYWKLRSK